MEGGDLRGTSMQLLEVVTAGVRILELGTAGAELVPGTAGERVGFGAKLVCIRGVG